MKIFGKIAVAVSATVMIGCGGSHKNVPVKVDAPLEVDVPVKVDGAGFYEAAQNGDNEPYNNEAWRETIILEDGRYYSFYENSSFSSEDEYVFGLMQGSGKEKGKDFVSTDLVEYSSKRSYASGSFNVSFPSDNEIEGTATTFLNGSSLKTNFKGVKKPKEEFDFDKKTDLNDVRGVWAANSYFDGAGAEIVVKDDQTLSGMVGEGCTFEGKIKPHASGKNIFDVEIKSGAAPCANAGESYSGVAAVVNYGNDGPELIVMGNNKERTAGIYIYGWKSGL